MSLRPRFTGPLSALDAAGRATLLFRSPSGPGDAVATRVAAIGDAIRAEGDRALRRLSLELDGVALERFEVAPDLVRSAPARIDPALRRALERAARNLERVHRAFMPQEATVESEPGVRISRRPDPLAAIGVYAPGGRASYPSSVLMGVVPARVAGVREIVVCSPPQPSGRPSDAVLAAAAIGSATRLLAIGGAQAIFALAHGTDEVPKVERIVGPGNSYVTEAKRQVAGFVGIDAPAGPSEILIIADDSAAPDLVARELVAQAEHDPEASCVALVTTDALQAAVLAALASLTPQRADIVRRAIGERGAVLRIDSLDEAWAFAADYAAEHVLLAIREPRSSLRHLRHAGTVFFGDGASVAFGDYLTGANHVLPTAGAGRSFSGLSTQDFVRFTTFQEVSSDAAAAMADDAAVLADAEGLFAHAAAARGHADPVRGPESLATPANRVRARPDLTGLAPYRGPHTSVAVDLSDNTNQRGAPPSASALVDASQARLMARYPSADADELKQAIAARLGVGIEEIVTGCGSDDVIECALRAFSLPGDRIAFSTPTFSMIPYFATTIGLTPVAAPLLPAARGYDADVDALLESRPAIVYLCSPNNPTGTLISKAAIDRVLAEAPSLVILDEAYVEYGGESFAAQAAAHGRLLVTRTFSKAYGLAGQRVGFAIGAPDLVREVEKIRGPYKVNAIGERAASLALQHDEPWVTEGVREVAAARERFGAWLTTLGLSPVPSTANFVLLPVSGALDRAAALRQRGVAVRAFTDLPGFGDCLRISVGPWDVMERALPALKEVLTCA